MSWTGCSVSSEGERDERDNRDGLGAHLGAAVRRLAADETLKGGGTARAPGQLSSGSLTDSRHGRQSRAPLAPSTPAVPSTLREGRAAIGEKGASISCFVDLSTRTIDTRPSRGV